MRLLIVLAVLGLNGCAATSYCTGAQDYQKAGSVEPIKSVAGTEVPQSPSALRIPPPPAQAVAFGETYTDADGDERVRCLDTPPALVPAPAPALAPAPAPGPEPAPQPAETPASEGG